MNIHTSVASVKMAINKAYLSVVLICLWMHLSEEACIDARTNKGIHDSYCVSSLSLRCLSDRITVSWTKPLYDPKITGYQLLVKENSTDFITSKIIVPSTQYQYSVLNTTSGKAYLINLAVQRQRPDIYIGQLDKGCTTEDKITEKGSDRSMKNTSPTPSTTPAVENTCSSTKINIKYKDNGIHEGTTNFLVCKIKTEKGKLCEKLIHQFFWYKNGRDISTENIASNNNRFKRQYWKRTDSGQYKCKAVVPRTNISLWSKELNVSVEYGPSKPNITVSNTTFIESQYRDAISCDADCNPKCEFVWIVNNSIITEKYRWPRWRGEIRKEYAGVYKCRVSNRIATVESDPVIVNVLQPPKTVYIRRQNVKYSNQYTLDEHENVTLECRTENTCNPPCSFRWWKGKKVTQSNPQLKVGDTLQFQRILRSDKSDYTCEAYNNVGSKTRTIEIKVEYADIVLSPTDKLITIRKGIPLPNVLCKFQCNPSCIHKYVIKNNRTETNAIYSEQRLFPKRLSKETDTGEYMCRAYFSHRRRYIYSHKVQLLVTYNTIIIGPSSQNRTIQEGERLPEVICKHHCSPSCQKLSMYKNDIYVKMLENEEALFNDTARRSDTGWYSCKARSRNGADVISSKIYIDVHYAPTIQQGPNENITVKEHTKLVLVWSVNSNPVILGKTFTMKQRHIKIINDAQSKTFSVIFDAVGRTDMGKYTLKVWNIIEILVRNYYLSILSVPRISSSTSKQTIKKIKIFNRFQKDIYVTGYPPPIMKFGKQSITGIPSTNGYYYRMLIKNVTKHYYGNYEVVLKNSEGEDRFNLTLVPSGKPLPPINIQANCNEPEKAEIVWQPQFEGESKQTFTIQMKNKTSWEAEQDNISETINNVNQISHTIAKLQPGVVHVFRVTATNKVGSVFSEETNCTILAFQKSLATSVSVSSMVVAVAASVVFLILTTIFLVVLLLRRKRRNIRKDLQDQAHDGVHDNVLYGLSTMPTEVSAPHASTSAASSSSGTSPLAPPSSTNDTDLVHGNNTKTPETEDAVYATVNKGGKGKANESDGTKNKIGKRSQKLKSKKKTSRTKNEDGLLYVEVEFANQVSGPSSKIIGIENKTEYVEIDFTKRADPLPDESSGSDSNTN